MAALALAAAGAADAASPKAAVQAWRKAHEKEILTDFSTLLAMPNVATNQADIEKNADYISGLLQKRGFATRKLYAEPGTPPSVFAELKVPGAKRTVTFYAHYDGQPVGQKGWISTPFEPSMRTALPEAKPVDWKAAGGPLDPEWRLFARSAGDDKGSIQALISALDALKAAGIKPSVNVKLLYEGEEEQGSPHFAALVAKHLETVRGDLLVMGDGPMHQSGRQQINFGNRGIASFKATVYGPMKPLHDGHYGSWAPSPTVMIAGLVMSLRDDDGHILIPGFYDDVTPVSAADKAALAALPDVETGLKQALGLGRNVGPARLADGYMRPTLNVARHPRRRHRPRRGQRHRHRGRGLYRHPHGAGRDRPPRARAGGRLPDQAGLVHRARDAGPGDAAGASEGRAGELGLRRVDRHGIGHGLTGGHGGGGLDLENHGDACSEAAVLRRELRHGRDRQPTGRRRWWGFRSPTTTTTSTPRTRT